MQPQAPDRFKEVFGNSELIKSAKKDGEIYKFNALHCLFNMSWLDSTIWLENYVSKLIVLIR